jgi:hypothetical protein
MPLLIEYKLGDVMNCGVFRNRQHFDKFQKMECERLHVGSFVTHSEEITEQVYNNFLVKM